MNFFDILIGILLGYSLYKGIRNGLFAELASFVSLIIGIYIAIKFSSVVKDVLCKYVSWNPTSVQVFAFVLTFILVIVGITLLAKFFTKITDFAHLGIFNSIGGGLFRALKTVLILSIVFAVFEKINFNQTFAKKETLDNMVFYRPVQKVAAFIFPSIEDFYDHLKAKATQKNTNN